MDLGAGFNPFAIFEDLRESDENGVLGLNHLNESAFGLKFLLLDENAEASLIIAGLPAGLGERDPILICLGIFFHRRINPFRRGLVDC